MWISLAIWVARVLRKAIAIIVILAKCRKCIGSMESLVDRDITICIRGLGKAISIIITLCSVYVYRVILMDRDISLTNSNM